MLASALRGALDGPNLYVTHTELHELLGRAHEAAGNPDSAAFHYRWVLHAWRNADRQFHARRDTVRARLGALAIALTSTAIRRVTGAPAIASAFATDFGVSPLPTPA